ncbi:MAG: HEAT repeat domain-containing protein [Gammaproteobacteria bacterium]|nr:HEAT repeat domain-containing protein [Gammaproteobacteria bacterium]
MQTNPPVVIPDAVLLVTPTCPHCPALVEILSRLTKQGAIGRLEIINVVVHPQAAQAYGIRSVPWFRIAALDFYGVYSAAEVERWVGLASSDPGIRQYLSEQLAAGHLTLVETKIHAHPAWLPLLVNLMGDMQAPLQARIGVGALLESLRGQALLQQALSPLIELTHHADHRVRSDACYYLGLTQAEAARGALQAALQDRSVDVRDNAAEALAGFPAPNP